MTSTSETRGSVARSLRTTIIRTHATLLAALGTALGFGAIAGGLWGGGMYPFLVTNHIGAVGLLQAYFLMALLGIAAWVATLTAKPLPSAWHWLMIAAHCVPLLAVALFVGSTAEMTINFVLMSLAIHAVGITSELVAVTRRD
ncbi:MAG: hypothetical protein ABIO40_07720 [Devosia sp.]